MSSRLLKLYLGVQTICIMAFGGCKGAVTWETALCSSYTNLGTYFYGKLETVTMLFRGVGGQRGEETGTTFP